MKLHVMGITKDVVLVKYGLPGYMRYEHDIFFSKPQCFASIKTIMFFLIYIFISFDFDLVLYVDVRANGKLMF